MRIIVADQNQKTLWALRTMLEEEPFMETVGEAVDAQQLQMVAEKNSADLVLLDRWLPGSTIEEMISDLQALEPRPFVLVMSSAHEDGRLILRAGADAFVSKGDQPDWLLETLRQYAKRTRQ